MLSTSKHSIITRNKKIPTPSLPTHTHSNLPGALKGTVELYEYHKELKSCKGTYSPAKWVFKQVVSLSDTMMGIKLETAFNINKMCKDKHKEKCNSTRKRFQESGLIHFLQNRLKITSISLNVTVSPKEIILLLQWPPQPFMSPKEVWFQVTQSISLISISQRHSSKKFFCCRNTDLATDFIFKNWEIYYVSYADMKYVYFTNK